MTTFWRTDFTGDIEKQYMVENGKLAWPHAVSEHDRQRLAARMTVGDGIVMARWLGKISRIEAIGRIVDCRKDQSQHWTVDVAWRTIPPKIVKPDAKDLAKWSNNPVFELSTESAARYDLPVLMDKHLPTFEALPGIAPTTKSERGATLPVYDLTEDVLRTLPTPYTEDVTEDIFLQIEADRDFFRRYNELVAHFEQTTPYGKDVVHNWIGVYAKQLTGRKTLRRATARRSTLIKSYAVLVPEDAQSD